MRLTLPVECPRFELEPVIMETDDAAIEVHQEQIVGHQAIE